MNKLEHQMKNGGLYVEYGHHDPEDIAYEQVIEAKRVRIKDLNFEYNNTRPSDMETKNRLLSEMLGSIGKSGWIEAPVHFSYGCNTHIGDYFYANFNMTIVDDCEVFIGDHVMIAPNVTISATGHPVWPEYRRQGAQFSLPVRIGNDVWIGSNVVILPGVTIGDGCVIGAGSVVTKDIPANTVAMGVPCRPVREITEEEKNFYRKGCPIQPGWDE